MSVAGRESQQSLQAIFSEASVLAEEHRLDLVASSPSRHLAGRTDRAVPEDAASVLARVRSHYEGVGDAAWRDAASLEDWVRVYGHTDGLRGVDLVAATVHNRVEEEVRRRFGVEIRSALARYRRTSPDRPPNSPRPTTTALGPDMVNTPVRATADLASNEGRPSGRASRRRTGAGVAVLAPTPEATVVWSPPLAAGQGDGPPSDLMVRRTGPHQSSILAGRPARAASGPGSVDPPYPSADAWLRLWLLPRWCRDAVPRWCSRWWLHPEAVSRVEAMWRAWSVVHDSDGAGLSCWWKEHADHHLGLLTSPVGPFSLCDGQQDQHRDPERLPTVPVPTGSQQDPP